MSAADTVLTVFASLIAGMWLALGYVDRRIAADVEVIRARHESTPTLAPVPADVALASVEVAYGARR